ncbi:MAG: nucleic acid-binding protein [Halobacteria archaeon]
MSPDVGNDGGSQELVARKCDEGHYSFTDQDACPRCGTELSMEKDLSDTSGKVVAATVSRATPDGVRTPNPLATVEFNLEEGTVTKTGQLTENAVREGELVVESGDLVEPVYVEQLRDTGESFKHEESQGWGGYRFCPVN